jgi:hypothetical protein
MNKIISTIFKNVQSIGVVGLLLWSLFCVILYNSIGYLMMSIENYTGIPNELYWYDLVIMSSSIFIFVYGIYILENR